MRAHLIDRDRLEFLCVGCRQKHLVDLQSHDWNHNPDSPTITPEVTSGECTCTITDGRAYYTKDSHHYLAGESTTLLGIFQ